MPCVVLSLAQWLNTCISWFQGHDNERRDPSSTEWSWVALPFLNRSAVTTDSIHAPSHSLARIPRWFVHRAIIESAHLCRSFCSKHAFLNLCLNFCSTHLWTFQCWKHSILKYCLKFCSTHFWAFVQLFFYKYSNSENKTVRQYLQREIPIGLQHQGRFGASLASPIYFASRGMNNITFIQESWLLEGSQCLDVWCHIFGGSTLLVHDLAVCVVLRTCAGVSVFGL